MRKSDVIAFFGNQTRVAEALTAAGFPLTPRAVSKWPDPIPLDRAVVVDRITKGRRNRPRLDFSVYEQRA